MAAATEKRRPEVLEQRRRPIDQLRLRDVRRNGDPFLAVLAEQARYGKIRYCE